MTDNRLGRWIFLVFLLLLAWGLRIGWLEEVPPGWRDDELINMHALSSRVLGGELPLYYLGASGHEPLYHHLHAGVLAVLGFNVLSGHILSAAFGTLGVALTYSLSRRLFPETRMVAVVAALGLTTSFWSLMYSRTAIRHISLPPFVLATLYVLWRRLEGDSSSAASWVPVGVLLGASLYTYTASRLLPLLVVVLAGYLAVHHRGRLRGHWRGISVALVVMALLVAPMGVAIARGRSERAIEGIGADARVTELAEPIRALRGGDPRPLLVSIVKTLGMFHASGDPEWLYNISGRPVFGFFGGILLWLGVGFCLYGWREPRFFLLLSWLGLGLAPAFVSTPPASLGHTILAQPVAYILPALSVVGTGRWVGGRLSWIGQGPRKPAMRSRSAVALIVAAFLISNAARDLRDYFIVWPERGMVRLLYRADQREIAAYVEAHPEISNVAVGSGLMGPWDRIALDIDIDRDSVAPRLFDPERALVWPAGQDPATVFLPTWPEPSSEIEGYLGAGRAISPGVSLRAAPGAVRPSSTVEETVFENGLALVDVQWLEDGAPSSRGEARLLTEWRVAESLVLPPIPVIAQPPPPKTYKGPRLAVFAHVLDSEGVVLDSDDGLWVDPLTLKEGDRFVQIHSLSAPVVTSAQPRSLALGLYDPKTNERWQTVGPGDGLGPDLVTIPIGGRK